ncbi:RING finger and transmembrane domain-containing protein 2 isoform X2 [Rhodamnia argentea]|uniref:RING finger and transmembrane domain-containing protein 2 isoform X2 n=1 Tax=Rhodamnia argentea TaxID=178133 RepID=A0ABM3HR91_9MYRT|nr:RING finger and transmembrane domain-containing protein 2 isoform X2 [Rhodamnia argentea]
MEASGGNSDPYRGSSVTGSSGSSSSSNSRRYSLLSASNLIQSPISTLLEYSGLLRTRPNHLETEPLFHGGVSGGLHSRAEDSTVSSNDGEVSIRIIGAGEQEHHRERAGLVVGQQTREAGATNEVSTRSSAAIEAADGQGDARSGAGEGASQPGNGGGDSEGGEANGRESSYQRYDIQQAARWIEQILPFSLLLLVVFIRQHLQGFFVTIWIAAVLFKSNDILRKQTALKGERKISFLIGISLAFTLHIVGVYWWYRNDDLLYPLIMFPPKGIPPFWHAMFVIVVNDTLARQAAMVIKCLLLIYFKNSRGRNYRKQGQMLTLVEYLLLLYRALLPTPVWYRFFLNKEYGSLFSSLMTGLYLTFKLTSVVEKVQFFFTALKALSRKDIQYGAYATAEQVNAAGDLCAICQEKMHAPILLRCKHIFCEDCVSEWFERERTCPLCRALVKPADLRSFGDGSTSLFFQIF